MTDEDRERFMLQFDVLGEGQVRKRLAEDRFTEAQRPLAEEWMRKKAYAKRQDEIRAQQPWAWLAWKASWQDLHHGEKAYLLKRLAEGTLSPELRSLVEIGLAQDAAWLPGKNYAEKEDPPEEYNRTMLKIFLFVVWILGTGFCLLLLKYLP